MDRAGVTKGGGISPIGSRSSRRQQTPPVGGGGAQKDTGASLKKGRTARETFANAILAPFLLLQGAQFVIDSNQLAASLM